MESQNIDDIEGIENINLSQYFPDQFQQSNCEFMFEVEEVAQKKKSTMKMFCEQSDIQDLQCNEIAEYGRVHMEANTFNSTSMLSLQKMKTQQEIEVCSCGCRKGVGQYLSICTNEQNLTFLGSGVLLFFFFLKHVRMVLVLLLMSYGIFSLITNVISQPNVDTTLCDTKSIELILCKLNLMSTFDLKKSVILRNFQLWMGFFLSIAWFFGISFIEYLGLKKEKEIDDLLDSASDYTIRVQNLPFGKYNQDQLISYINELWETRTIVTPENFESVSTSEKIELKSIQIIYNMSQCRKLIDKIQMLSLEINQILHGNKIIRDKKSIKLYKSKKRQLLKKLEEIEDFRINFTKSGQFRRQLSTTCALLQFKFSEQQTQFLEIYGQKESNALRSICEEKNKQTFLGSQIIFARAPEPSDFNWSNCQIRYSICRYIMIWSITVIILSIAYSLTSYLQKIPFVQNYGGFIISIVLQFFNRIIWLSLSYLVTFQYSNTKTQYIISLMRKSVFAQVLNVIVSPIANMFVNNKPIYGQGSLAMGSLNYQFSMFFMMFVFYLLNPSYYLKKIIICIPYLRNIMIRRLCEVVGEIDTINQIRPVLTYYQGPQFPVAGAYVYMTTAIFHTLFYCHIQPVLLIISVVNFTAFHLILKYLLFRRCKIPELTDVQIFKLAVQGLKYGCFFFGAGSLFFIIFQKFNQGIQINFIQIIPSSLALIVNFILFLKPFKVQEKINELLFYVFTFNRDFKKQKQVLNVSQLIAGIFLNNFQNKVSYERKESYYKNSNLHKLFNYESELKEIANQKSVQRNRALQFFCQSFFNQKSRSLNNLTNRKSFNLNEDLMQMILIPSLQIYKTKNTKDGEKPKTEKKKENNENENQEDNFKKAQLIISKIFAKK